ncbi:MAG: hypothetical protein MZW92_28975 [Comamonadaceae bacterium]|nr:hypothetical protein [Comamonadaceae bacterium]
MLGKPLGVGVMQRGAEEGASSATPATRAMIASTTQAQHARARPRPRCPACTR